MKRAYVHLRDGVPYRLDAFVKGFTRLGYQTSVGAPREPVGPDDVAVVWNKSGRSRETIEQARVGGGALIVAENGYYGVDEDGIQNYALALDGHNGSGRWYVGDDSRLRRLGIEFKPWRPCSPLAANQGRVLIAAQRGIGAPNMASPHNFAEDVAAKERARGFSPTIREHPGRHEATTTLLQDLEGVEALIVWSSNCATQALIEGVPVLYAAPTIITASAAYPYGPPRPPVSQTDRPKAFERLAWAQWSLGEIKSGEALQTLIDVHAGRLPSCQPGLGL